MTDLLLEQAKEALQKVFSSATNQHLLIVVEPQNPYFLLGLRQNLQPHQHILVLEINPRNANDDPENKIYYSCGQQPTEFINRSKEILEQCSELSYRIIFENDQQASQFSGISNLLNPKLNAATSDITGTRYREGLQLHNFIGNIPFLSVGRGIAELKNIAQNKTVYVLGAGPSLNEKIPFLKEKRQQIFIVAAGSVSAGLQKHDLNADLYVETDHRSPTHWRNADKSNSSVIFTSTVSACTSKGFKNVFWAEANSEHRKWIFEWEKKLCPEIDLLPSPDQNTGLTAAGVAVYLGARRIVYVGIDLCLSNDGDTHSTLFHQGKDKHIIQNCETVHNNLGESCLTIYGGFIRGFEQLAASCSEIEFIQSSANGAALKGVAFRELSTIELDKGEINLPERKNYQSTKDNLSNIQNLLNELSQASDEPKTNLQVKTLTVAKINHVLSTPKTSLELALNREKKKYTEYLTRFLKCLSNETLSIEDFELSDDFSDVGLLIDWQSEYKIAGLSEPFKEVKNSSKWQLDWQRNFMMQLLIQKNDRYIQTSGQYELIDKAKDLINQHLVAFKGNLRKIICLGIWDGNYMTLLAQKFPHLSYTIIEPNDHLTAKILKHLPLASKFPSGTRWLNNTDDVTVDDETLIICPDKEGKFLPYLKEAYLTLIS